MPKVNQHVLQEIKLRGTYLRLSVDADFMLAMIIANIFINNPQEIKTFFKKNKNDFKDLHELDMFEKIEVCKRGLNKYHQKFYKEYAAQIDKLNILRDDRNKFAHQLMRFSNFDTYKIQLSKLINKGKVSSKEYSLSLLWKELYDHDKSVRDVLDILSTFMKVPNGLSP